MKKYLSPLIKNSFKTIFKSYILSKKVYVDIEYINLKILKNCSLGQKNESIILPIDNIILPSILKTGAWESHIIKLVKKYSKKRRFIFLDIGANIGLISRQVINSKINISKIFCFEPDKEKIKLIRHNLSKYKNIKIMNYGLGKKDINLKLYKNIYNFGDTSFIKKTSNFSKAKVKNINNFFIKNLSQSKLPIIYKSDTQGMDEEIILSLKETFLKNIEILIIEISNNKAILKNINKFNKIIKFFSKFYIHNQRVSKKNVINKIQSRNEFDLIMVK